MAFIMQPLFKMQSAAPYTGHLVLASQD